MQMFQIEFLAPRQGDPTAVGIVERVNMQASDIEAVNDRARSLLQNTYMAASRRESRPLPVGYQIRENGGTIVFKARVGS